ncbi:hypothetical protein TNCV_376481 [Trichonephila clavipes]|nr:hypothetical protein TNCV_376481 [Trichonephila clavipes]
MPSPRGLEVAFPSYKPKVAVSIPAIADRFSKCENCRHGDHNDYVACTSINLFLSSNLIPVLVEIFTIGRELELNKFRRQKFGSGSRK